MDKVQHFEIAVDDISRAKKFYESLFGWKTTEMPMPEGGVYVGLQTGPVDEKSKPSEHGYIGGGMFKRDPHLPDVPVPKDLGYEMSFIPTLRGVEAPPNTPADIVKILEDAFRKAAQEQGFIDIAAKRKMVLEPVGSREFAKAVADVYPKIAKFEAMLAR